MNDWNVKSASSGSALIRGHIIFPKRQVVECQFVEILPNSEITETT